MATKMKTKGGKVGTVYGSSNKSGGGSSSSKLEELETLSAKAKGMGIDTTQADSMVAQTKAQGKKSYSGSSYENDYLKSDSYKKSLMGTPLISSQQGKNLVTDADQT